MYKIQEIIVGSGLYTRAYLSDVSFWGRECLTYGVIGGGGGKFDWGGGAGDFGEGAS